jgi:hypothetical protein
MISVETARPVYSAFGGKDLTPEQKKERQKKRIEKAKQIYQTAKETGSLTALENIAMRAGAPLAPTTDPNSGGGAGGGTNGDPKGKGWSDLSTPYKVGIIGGSILVVGLAVWYFGFRNKAKK